VNLTDDPGTLFVSPNPEAGPVRRYGMAGRVIIGGRRDAADPTKILHDVDVVVAIPAGEARLYRREYRSAIDAKSLIKRTRADWIAFNERQTQAEKERAERYRLAKLAAEAAAAASSKEVSP
jgi:hypothetical protein